MFFVTAIIEIEGLTKQYNKVSVVNQISLKINEGEIFGFICPNGAGKSTTIKMLLNFIFPTEGTAKIFGKDCVKESVEIKKEVGYVSSDVRYYQGMTSMDIFKYTAAFHHLSNSQRIIDKYIQLFEIEPHKKIEKLSLGNKKKVAIVAALLQEPKLLILDEPTNGLDPMIQHRLFDVLEQKSQEGMTIFLSSHDLHEIQAHCHRAAFIKNGEILAVETINEGNEIAKKVSVISSTLGESDLRNLGVNQLHQKEGKWEFIYQGDIQLLIHVLNEQKVEELEIKPLDLEDKFLSMYE